MAVYTDGGLAVSFPKFCFGPKVAPKEAFGTKIIGNSTENHEDSENPIDISQHNRNIANLKNKTKK